AKSRHLFIVRLYTGRAGRYPSIEEAETYPYSDRELAILHHARQRTVAGTAGQVGERRREPPPAHQGRGARRRTSNPRSEGPAPVLRAPGQSLRTRGDHPMTSRLWLAAGSLALASLLGLVLLFTGSVNAQRPGEGQAPRFQVDPWWPKLLPNNWLMGQ